MDLLPVERNQAFLDTCYGCCGKRVVNASLGDLGTQILQNCVDGQV